MFDKFTSLEHLYNSFLIAYKGRNKTREVIEYKQNLEENLMKLQEKLISLKYKHRKYRTFIVEDSKKRVINAPSFEDHILHHAVFSFLEEIFDKKFIENSFANRKNKGSHKAVTKLQKESKRYDYFLKMDTKKNHKDFSSFHFKYNWYLKMDITKYFQSVDQEILFEQIKRYVKDEKFLYYVKIIIESCLETNIINPLTSNPTGMPIGNVTSQLFANIYLHDLDFYVENIVKPRFRKQIRDIFYIRYVDDFVFLAKEKKDLIKVRDEILDFLKTNLLLSVSPKKLVLNNIESGIPFLGYTVFRHKLKVRNDTLRRFKRRIGNYSDEKKVNSLISFKGHCDLANKKLIISISDCVFFSKHTLLPLTENVYKHKKQFLLLYDSARGFSKRIQQEDSARGFSKRIQQEDSARWRKLIVSPSLGLLSIMRRILVLI